MPLGVGASPGNGMIPPVVKLLRAHGGCLGSRTEEGRGYLRKASASWKQALTRGRPNGETH
jgi:hypothetical protein